MNIAIDFDGTICKRVGIPTQEGFMDCKPYTGALETIKLLQSLGHKVWISTSNSDIDRIKVWLESNRFPELEVTNIKKPAHVYIDDRAIRFTNWQDIRKYFG